MVPRRVLILALATLAAGLLPAAAAAAAAPGSERVEVGLPAAAEATSSKVLVRAAPRSGAKRVARMNRLRFDYRPTTFFVIKRLQTERDGLWYEIRVPGRPNGQKGWVRASSLRLTRYVGNLVVVIDRSKRELRLLQRGRTVLKKPVAVGTSGAPTPLGHFYMTAGFRPRDDFLGPWAFETSAYAAITDWPRGGIVGLHGTSVPSSVGKAASHGCLRVRNDVILKLKKRVVAGTPLLIKR